MEDKFLSKQEKVGDDASARTTNLYKVGLDICDISDEQIQEYGVALNSFYEEKSNRNKIQVTRNALTMLQGAIVAIGTSKMDNPEWKEHSASSLREIYHEWDHGDLSSDFAHFYKSKNEGLVDKEKEFFVTLKNRYSYFTGIDHHNADKVMFSLRKLQNNEALKLGDCYTDEVFIGQAKEFLHDIEVLKKMIDK